MIIVLLSPLPVETQHHREEETTARFCSCLAASTRALLSPASRMLALNVHCTAPAAQTKLNKCGSNRKQTQVFKGNGNKNRPSLLE